MRASCDLCRASGVLNKHIILDQSQGGIYRCLNALACLKNRVKDLTTRPPPLPESETEP